jgi:hypothetical protein
MEATILPMLQLRGTAVLRPGDPAFAPYGWDFGQLVYGGEERATK